MNGRNYKRRKRGYARRRQEMLIKGLIIGFIVVALCVTGVLIYIGITGKDKNKGQGNRNEQTAAENKEPTKESKEPVTEDDTVENKPDTSKIPGFVGFSEKGYVIRQENGVTYVNDILIANKTYGLPQTYVRDGIDKEVQAAFDKMQADASKLGLNIWIASGYRSYELQKKIYNSYVAQDGQEKADTYSARPGKSEHQTGLCFDLNSITDEFAYTEEGKWVAEHAHEYGFIIRYPKGKQDITGYKYEPWHLRYLGNDLAQDVYKSRLCLEEYLGITSKYE